MSEKQKPLVLIMDPDPTVSASLLPLLEAEGYRVVSCSATPAPMAAVRRLRPDVVIVSKKRENCDGMLLIGRVKETYPGTQAILCVERDDWPSPLDAADAGANEFYRKGSGARAILESVQRLLARVQGQRDKERVVMGAH